MEAWFDCAGHFSMGARSIVNQKCRLDNRGGIRIGHDVAISAEVCILTADHDPRSERFAGRAKAVEIEDYVFIGTRALILPGVTIGRGAIVAAGAIVTKNVEPFTIVAGSPARAIGQRNPQLNYQINYSRLFV